MDASAPQWSNWSKNLVHEPPTNGADYYFRPTDLAELKSVLADAATKEVTVRVSGQRHSQTPLVAGDNRGAAPSQPTTYLVDMSCYADLGPDSTDSMVLGPGRNQVTVNPGVKEDALDEFLTNNNLMLETVTAGGFFSIGGMTAVDVHGGTVEAPIFAETASAFTILGADGNATVINEESEDKDGNALLPFARVSLGALGIVTRITLNVLPRSYANTLQGGTDWYRLADDFKLQTDPAQFIAKFKELLTGAAKHTRMECFFTPYAAPFWGQNNFLVLWWNVVANPQPAIPISAIPKPAPDPKTACELSRESQFGAPLIAIGQFAEEVIRAAQTTNPYWSPLAGPAVIAKIALDEIDSQVKTANLNYSELWLAKSSRAIFMSYFVELPNLDDAGLKKAWEGLDVVNTYVTQTGKFHIAAPMEFRFVKAGDTVMSGTFSTNRDAYFVNLDLIGFTEPAKGSDYPAELLKFFAHVERKWVAMGGVPHSGKMFGFYDPTDPAPDSYTPPFNQKFLSFITGLRRDAHGAPVDAFKKYRQACDPNGLFYTPYLRDMLEG